MYCCMVEPLLYYLGSEDGECMKFSIFLNSILMIDTCVLHVFIKTVCNI